MVSTQLAATPMCPQYNDLKIGIYIPGTLEALGVPGLDPSENLGKLTDRLFNSFVKEVSHVFFAYKERCQSDVCHR